MLFWMSQCFEITNTGKKNIKETRSTINFFFFGLKHEKRKQYAEVKLYLQERENPRGRRTIFFATVTEVCALSLGTYVCPYFHITK